MPKSLHSWLHYQALQWAMPSEAVQEYQSRMWHRPSGNESWTECGKWVDGANLHRRVGFSAATRNKWKSPWWGRGHIPIQGLCRSCFAVELPLLIELQRVAIDNQPIEWEDKADA
jgi:hypothetical protein